ncbi:hypothetical protein HGA11_27405 [Mycolicibacterium septicum DSM 44393]|uniref:PE-PGRS family protein n=1 Tax=Mycolicibacterium septicum DSM 44393 TaxID=1341646 RepID=A0A7X6MVC6_9MYCO|nr:hypothetical protein [Mycolicibacterium septicum]NKZ14716.1 hypothetical protein [Mycolicibacterium septicum DSM 44393]
MNLALRPYATAGIALVGASVIAATPLAPPAPDVHLPTLPTQAAVELSAFTNPLDTWASVLTATLTDVGALGQAIADNPAPILRQVIANQMANATKLAGIGQAVATGIGGLLNPSNPYSSVSLLQQAVSQAAAGDVADAIDSVYSALIIYPAFSVGFPLLGTFDVINGVTTNVQKFVAMVPNLVIAAGMTSLGTLGSIEFAFKESAQGFVDAIKTGDVETAAGIALNAPAVLAGAALNGYAPFGGSGLLGAYGPIRAFVDWQERAAEAIGKPTPPPTFPEASARISSAPDAAAAPTVALAVDPAPAAPETDTASLDSPATEGVTPKPAKQATVRLVRQSLAATPGKTGSLGATSKPAAKVASDVRGGISSTVNKISEGVKKAFAKPEKKPASASTSSDKGSGSGSSSDSK